MWLNGNNMIIRILVYIFIEMALLIWHKYGVYPMLDISSGLSIPILLFAIYLLMLYYELQYRFQRKISGRSIIYAGSLFSFWIGTTWGIMMTFAAGYNPNYQSSIYLVLPLNGLLIGILFAILGVGISSIAYSVRRWTRKRERT